MNLERFENISLFLPKSIAGICLFATDESNFKGELVILERKKKEIKTVSQVIIQGSIKDICKQIPENISVCISIDGKGILFKDWHDEETSKSKIFRELLPQGNHNEFYLQQQASCDKYIVGIARKNYIDGVIAQFKDAGFQVIDVVFGPFILNKTVSLISEMPSPWLLPNRIIHWENNIIESIQIPDGSESSFFSFGQETISSEYLVAFSHAFWALVSPGKLHKDVEITVINRSNQYYKKAIKYIGVGVLAFYFTLLIVNYLLFSSYSNKLNNTYAAYEVGLKTINKLENYTTELQQKELLAKKVGLGARIQLSFLADRIAATIPEYINFTQFQINPLDSKRQRKNAPEFLNGDIYISGNISNGVQLYKWLEKLKRIEWVQQVEVNELNQEDSSKQALFSITIKYSTPSN